MENYSIEESELLSDCTLCPRNCGVNRFDSMEGYCGTGAGLNIASICVHRGEEPPISGNNGICNIFFAGCNLRCRFCQNYDISHPGAGMRYISIDLATALDTIEGILTKGISAVGFVSPSHVVPQVKAIIQGLNNRELYPTTVYNTNSFDKRETIRDLAGLIDVYLPDYKYVSHDLAYRYSDAYNYPDIALSALKEMYYQKGSTLVTGSDGIAEQGLLIRHLVLPGHVEESKAVLQSIAEELSPGVSLSLMSQYHPSPCVKNEHPLNRSLHRDEYEEVVEEMNRLGFRNGWLQDPESYDNYLPDFNREHPFE